MFLTRVDATKKSVKMTEEKKMTTENPVPEATGEEKTESQKTEETGHVEHEEDHKSTMHRKSKKDKSQEMIHELETKIADFSDRHLRLQAEFDNFRKRTLKEKAELIKSGGEHVLVNMLPVIDDFDRALEAMKEVPDDDPAKIGFQLIYNKFKEFLKKNHVKEIEAVSQPFDVDLHEAITKIPAPSEELKGKVVDVILKGYLLNDKVIRFAKVVIGE